MYKMLGHDKAEYGPVSAEALRQWIAEGRANAQTLIQAAGATEFKPLAQFPEFQQALAAAAAGRPPAAAPAAIPGDGTPENKSLAVTSLVLGILSFFLFLLSAIPAIITGHMALSRIRREPARYSGRGLATAGLVLGYLNIAMIPVIAILAGLMLPALAKAKGKAQRINCVNNLKQIALAARIHSNENNEVFPTNFVAMSTALNTPKVLVCPADGARSRAESWSTFLEPDNVTYEFLLPGAQERDVANQTVFRCPIHNNVALGDGSVQQLPGGRWR